MLKPPAFPQRQAGLTLIELMIAIVAGLIVIGAALTFTVSTVRAYGENIRSTRLSQELRTGMNLVVRELRRAGYDGAAQTRVLTDSVPSNFVTVSAPTGGGCLFYEYDRGVGAIGDTPASDDKRGIRYSTTDRAVQMDVSDATSDCTGTGWVDLTDPRVINITAFKPTVYQAPFCRVVASRDTDADGVKDQFDTVEGKVRVVSLCLKGSLVSDPSVVRQMTDSVRIRADELVYRFNLDNAGKTACDAMTAAAVTATPGPATLSANCDAL